MTTLEAAKHLRDQFRDQGSPAPWSECMRLAAECRQEAQQRDKAKRAQWFMTRRHELRGERWRQRLRVAPLITPARHAATVAREGGWTIEYCEPTEKDEEAA